MAMLDLDLFLVYLMILLKTTTIPQINTIKCLKPSFVQRLLLLFLSLGQIVHLHTLHVSAFTEPSSGVFIHETCHILLCLSAESRVQQDAKI
jgi:hypothetical protein